MKDTYTSMKNALSKLNLYSFDDTYISYELKAYAFLLDELNDEIVRLCDESFIDSASTYGLDNRELIIGAKREDLSIEERRKMLKLRESINLSSFTVDKIKESILSFGLKCEIFEYPSMYLVRVDAVGDYSKAQQAWIASEIKKIMPAHLSVQVVFGGPSWNESDTKSNTFTSIDNFNYSWDEIDNME